MESALSTVVERVMNFVLDQSVRQVAYIVRYGQNVDELYHNVKDLGLEKERVDHKCDEAEKNLHRTEGTVKEWFQKVDEFETMVEKFRNDEAHTKTRISNGLFAYLRNRHRLGREATEMAEVVKKLMDESTKFNEVAYRENVTSNDSTLSNVGYVEFGSRKSTMEDIMAKLEDSSVGMIGLHGPGGVGKSTLIKEIATQARDKKLFNVVVIAEITANPNPLKIQEEIAYVLGLRLEGEGETVRADCLRRRLKKEKENTLVILDDLWDGLDLNKLGIPLDDDDDDDGKLVNKEKSLGDYKGCKILLTSRHKNVLSDKMEVKSIFCVNELDDNDALMLFQKVAGIPDEISDSKQEIVKKYCAGLPVAIVAVGRALRDKSELMWEATLEKLKKQELVGVQTSMEISVKMSYEHLENEELKSIFLLGAQMGHQPLIMDLVKYCFGLGILEGVYSLMEARGRIRASINKLKDSSLMTDGSSSNNFNMHDMVRDAALSIAHKEKNVFTLRNGKLDDWTELETCTSISICNSDIIDELPNVLNCPQVKFFRIDSNDPSLIIPDSFFKEMKKLRVLILTGIQQSSLPSSISCLSNLRMLCLERCTLEGNLSIIEKLKKLRILSLSGSQVENFPAEVECLDKLQLLDISNCSIGKMISPKFISRLIFLEELYIRMSLVKMLVRGEANQSKISFLSEIKHLHQLKVVDLCIPWAAVFPGDLLFDKLNDYKLVIGDFNILSDEDFQMPNKYEAFRSLALQLKDDTIHSQKGIKLLFKRVENLLLGELKDVQNVIYELNLDGFPDLKQLSIRNNTSIKYISNSKDLSHPLDVFPNLESLYLYKLKNIEKICCSPVTDASFTKLKTIKIKMCAKLKNLFSFHMVKFLVNLETIDVSECNSVTEMVEIAENSDKVEFLKLQSLTLQSLSSLTCFYNTLKGSSAPHLIEAQKTNRDHIEISIVEDEHKGKAPPLFGEKLEIPNLESLNLSMVNIYSIWSDQPSSFCFQNLIKLVVKDCRKMRYLCSLPVASSLRKLKKLFVSGCVMMENIFRIEGRNSDDKVCIFPKLEEIHLSDMASIKEIWQGEVSADSFSSLNSVLIQRCLKLDKIFPSHMQGWFASLSSLKVYNCKSVEVIFEIKDSQQIDAPSGIDTNLQHIDVGNLPNLKQVWSTVPIGILNFKKMQSTRVSWCKKLKNVFPASVAKDVQQLKHMLVWECEEMVEIVACEDETETNSEPLVFPELISMRLSHLSNIKHFYNGRHPIECPKLKKLGVDGCKKLKTFPTETSETTYEKEKTVFSAEKVFPNLEFMDIDFDQARKWLLNNTAKYRMHRLKVLKLSCVKSCELLCQFLYRMPNLEKLKLFRTDHLLKESSVPCLGTVLQLKELVLSISRIKDLGFEGDPILQRLELLSLNSCYYLIKLAPPSVSFSYLTYLEVKHCGLKNLIASLTAKSLVQLKTMKVSHCGYIKEIVTNEGNEEKDIEIVFRNLITIELDTLKSLKSFCSYGNCKFKFPSLEILILKECPKIETFTESRITTPRLQHILKTDKGEKVVRWQLEGDLNATIQNVFQYKISANASRVSRLELNRDPLLQRIWHGSLPIPDLCFSNLDTLNMYELGFLSDVLPFDLLPLLPKLETLDVQRCGRVKTIFDVKYTTQDRKMKTIEPAALFPLPFHLKILTLKWLPNLENVWNEDPHGILGMQLLQEVHVENCESLTSLFPMSVAKDLVKLEKLEVQDCKELMEIVAEDHNVDPSGTNLELTLPCPCVRSLKLRGLPKFKYFCYCSLQCDILKTYTLLEPHTEDQVCIEKPSPNLQCLSLGENGLKMIQRGEFQRNLLHKLKVLTLCFHIESDTVFPYEILQEVPNIEKLGVSRSSFKEIFCCQSPNNVDYTGLLLQLKALHLDSLEDLVSIGFDNSWIEPFLRNLETLEVTSCSGLRNLTSSPVCFSNLISLIITECHGLINLFMSSTAKSLARLKTMKVDKCESIQEIVSKERGESDDEDEQIIIFEKLQVLFLEELDQLRSFYPGNFTLHFPSLRRVYLINCPRMKTFSPSNKINSTEWFSSTYVTPKRECDLNLAVRRTFEENISERAGFVSCLILGDNPLLQEIWHDSLPIPNLCFRYLHSLIVDGCQFLSEVLPFNLLPLLPKLETLEVRKCDSVKTIFDVKCTITLDKKVTTMGPASFPLPFPLKKLTLSELPNLENVWNEDPHRILRIQLLQEVHVDKCECLASVFPTSVAQDLVKLETLVVQHCEELMAIVADPDNADPRGKNPEIKFPCLKSLTLLDLPKFKYNGIRDATMTFELMPNLHELTLGENELKMILPREFQKNLFHKLKILTLFFHIESNVFLEHVPNIQKLVVSDGSFKEIFCIPKLKVLCLEPLGELISIGLENSWIEPFQRNLETLEVMSCFSSINLVPHTVSFSNMTYLEISSCNSLLYLFTSSTATSLVQLKIMEIKCCNSIEEIVSKEGGESHEDEIVFQQLNCLNLCELQNLKSFYKGSLSLPSLEQLSITGCNRMETLCPGTVKADNLFEVKLQKETMAITLEIDLNTTMRKEFQTRA